LTIKIGNWSDFDKVRVTMLKLMEIAKAFYACSVDLRKADVRWEALKAKFLHRF
jgi:hypothetical protein